MEKIIFDKSYLLEVKSKIKDFIDSINSSFDLYFEIMKDERLAYGFKFPLFWDDNDFGSFLRTNGILDQYKEYIVKKGLELIDEIDVKLVAFDELHNIKL